MASRAPTKRPSTSTLATPAAPAPRKPVRPSEPPPRRAPRVREKVVQALKRLHPMD